MCNDEEQDLLVSIIMPVYNSRKYLKESLESVTGQTYRNLEIIVVDDASTDGSYDMMQAYAAEDARIVILREPQNAGVSHARNTGLRAAHGEYCCFVDSDDTADCRMVEKLLMLMQSNRADMAACSEECPDDPWWPEGMVLMDGMAEFPDNRERLRYILDKYLPCRQGHCGYCVHGKMYARRLLLDNGVFFQEGITIGEDLAFNLKLLFIASRIVTCSEPLYTYYNRDGSLSAETKSGRILLPEYDLFLNDIYSMCGELKSKRAESFWLKYFYVIYAATMDIQLRARKIWKLKQEAQQLRDSTLWRRISVQVIFHPCVMRKYTNSFKLYLKIVILNLLLRLRAENVRP